MNKGWVVSLGLVISSLALIGCAPTSTITITPKNITTTSTATVTQTITAPPITITQTMTAPPITITVTSTPSPTTTTPGTPIIVITYSGITTNQIGSGSFPNTPQQGYIYLVVTFSIENRGYSEFRISSSYFNVVVNNILYEDDLFASVDLEDYMTRVSVLNGGTFTGSLAYEVKITDIGLGFTPVYDGYGTFNIEWIEQ